MVSVYGNGERAGTSSGSEPSEQAGIAWIAQTDAPVVASPVLAGRRLIVADAGGTVYAFDATSGEECWRYAHRAFDEDLETEFGAYEPDDDWTVGMGDDEPGIVTSPAVYGTWVFVEEGQSTGWVYVHDVGSGRVLHTIKQGGCPTVFGDILLLQDINAGVRAVRLPDLTPLWRSEEDDDFEGWLRVSPALGGDDVACAAFGNEAHRTCCGVTAFDIRTGQQLFHREDNEEIGEEHGPYGDSGEPVLFVPEPAVAAEGLVWLSVVRERQDGSQTPEILGLDPRSGADRWSYGLAPESNGCSRVAVSADSVYFTTGDRLYAVDLTSRELRWSASVTAETGSPVLATGEVYTAARNGTVQAFDAATGEPRWTVETGQEVISSYDYFDTAGDGAYYEEDDPAVVPGDGLIYLRSRTGVVALR